MAIAYRASATAGDSSGGNLTINKPTGTADGDIMIMALYREAGTWTLPSGWTQVVDARDYGSDQMYLTIAWKRASSEGSSYSVTLSTTTWRMGSISSFSGGLESGDPIDTYAANSTNFAAVTLASITTTVDDTMRVALVGDYGGGGCNAGSSGMSTAVGPATLSVFYLALATAGSTGSITLGSVSGSGQWASVHLAIKPATGGGAQSVTPNTISSAITVHAPTVTPGAVAITPNTITSGVTMHAPTVTPGAVTIAPDTIASTTTMHAPTVTLGGAAQGITPDTIASTTTVHSPTVTTGAITITPDTIASAATVHAPTVTPGSVTVTPDTIVSTTQVYAPVIGDSTFNYNVQVGDGYTDVSPRQLVRTSTNYLYTIAPNCDSYPDFSATGLTQTIRVHKADSVGVPSGFTRKDSSNEPAAVVGCAAALDSDDNIRIVWAARNTSSNTRYLRYAVFDTSTDTWGSVTTIASDLDYDDIGQGDQTVAVAVDASDVVHVVYLGTAGSGTLTDRRIYYRNNSGGSWSSATQIDSGVTYTGNLKAWHPSIAMDAFGRIVVAWERGDFNDSNTGTIYTNVYDGSWAGAVQTSAAGDSVLCSIDQSTSLLVTPDGTYHLSYVLYSATNSQKYIRYRYSTNQGATWAGNNPTDQATHNPSLGWTGSKVRIIAHGTPDESNHGENLYYFEGDGGSAAWGSWTQFVTGTNYDSSVNIRWAQFHHHYPNTFDLAYWNDAYPNVLYAGTEIFALDVVPVTIASTATVHAPTVTQGAVTIAPDAIASTATVHAPTVTVGAVTVLPDAIASVATVYGVTVTVGAVTVEPDTIASVTTFYDVTVTASGTIVPDTIANTTQVYEPTVTTGAVTVEPDAIASTTQVYAPTIVPGAITVEPDTIVSTAVVHSVTVTIGAATILPDTIASVTQFYTVAILAIAAGRTYRVAVESRTYSVAAESRVYTVEE